MRSHDGESLLTRRGFCNRASGRVRPLSLICPGRSARPKTSFRSGVFCQRVVRVHERTLPSPGSPRAQMRVRRTGIGPADGTTGLFSN